MDVVYKKKFKRKEEETTPLRIHKSRFFSKSTPEATNQGNDFVGSSDCSSSRSSPVCSNSSFKSGDMGYFIQQSLNETDYVAACLEELIESEKQKVNEIKTKVNHKTSISLGKGGKNETCVITSTSSPVTLQNKKPVLLPRRRHQHSPSTPEFTSSNNSHHSSNFCKVTDTTENRRIEQQSIDTVKRHDRYEGEQIYCTQGEINESTRTSSTDYTKDGNMLMAHSVYEEIKHTRQEPINDCSRLGVQMEEIDTPGNATPLIDSRYCEKDHFISTHSTGYMNMGNVKGSSSAGSFSSEDSDDYMCQNSPSIQALRRERIEESNRQRRADASCPDFLDYFDDHFSSSSEKGHQRDYIRFKRDSWDSDTCEYHIYYNKLSDLDTSRLSLHSTKNDGDEGEQRNRDSWDCDTYRYHVYYNVISDLDMSRLPTNNVKNECVEEQRDRGTRGNEDEAYQKEIDYAKLGQWLNSKFSDSSDTKVYLGRIGKSRDLQLIIRVGIGQLLETTELKTCMSQLSVSSRQMSLEAIDSEDNTENNTCLKSPVPTKRPGFRSNALLPPPPPRPPPYEAHLKDGRQQAIDSEDNKENNTCLKSTVPTTRSGLCSKALLPPPLPPPPYEAHLKEAETPLQKEVQNHYDKLVRCDPDNLTAYLLEKQAITYIDMEKINAKPNERTQMEELLRLLFNKQTTDWPTCLIHSLLESPERGENELALKICCAAKCQP